jgi:hypothetical protein
LDDSEFAGHHRRCNFLAAPRCINNFPPILLLRQQMRQLRFSPD